MNGDAAQVMAENDRQRIDLLIDKLPTRRFQTDQDVAAMKIADLKKELRCRGVCCKGMIEKSELVVALNARRERCCSVCSEEFEPDGAYRRTLCGHGFHEQCLRAIAVNEYDRNSRMPHCPLCRQALNCPPEAVKRALEEADLRPPPRTDKRHRPPHARHVECKMQ